MTFNFFRKNILSAETDVIFYITCNTSTFSVSVTSNYASLQYKAVSKIVPSSFVSVILITVALDFFLINLTSSIFGKRLFTFICKKCNPFLSGTFQLRKKFISRLFEAMLLQVFSDWKEKKIFLTTYFEIIERIFQITLRSNWKATLMKKLTDV